jgi:negative regulator of replication initiation
MKRWGDTTAGWTYADAACSELEFASTLQGGRHWNASIRSKDLRNGTGGGFQGNLEFWVQGNAVTTELPAMVVDQSGYVGIGITNPDFPLHVKGPAAGSGTGWSAALTAYIHGTSASHTWQHAGGTAHSVNASGHTTDIGGGINVVGVRIEQGLICKRQYVMSDSRIKKDIIDVSDDQALVVLRQLQPKKYKYKDSYLNGGNIEVYGFIAQEVRTVIPSSITIQKDYIPDIMVSAKIIVQGDSSILTTQSDHGLQTNDIISCRDAKYNSIDGITVEVVNSKTIKINKIFTPAQTTFKSDDGFQEENVIYIFGKQVNDFHNLNKDAIWTVATAALQEVDRQLQAEKDKTVLLQGKVTDLETKVVDLTNENNELKSQLQTILDRLNALENN